MKEEEKDRRKCLKIGGVSKRLIYVFHAEFAENNENNTFSANSA